LIRRNIDIVAISILLAVIAICSQAREAMLLQVLPNHGIVLSSDIVQRVLGNCPGAGTPVPPLPSLAFYR
jgi:hypothetical protein